MYSYYYRVELIIGMYHYYYHRVELVIEMYHYYYIDSRAVPLSLHRRASYRDVPLLLHRVELVMRMYHYYYIE